MIAELRHMTAVYSMHCMGISDITSASLGDYKRTFTAFCTRYHLCQQHHVMGYEQAYNVQLVHRPLGVIGISVEDALSWDLELQDHTSYITCKFTKASKQ
jgi:hypothetical protein